MSHRLIRVSFVPFLLFAGQVFALGLGEIRLESALNEPLRAQVELIGATEEEVASLKVELASADAFARYGLDRPGWLADIDFAVQRNSAGELVIGVSTPGPVTEPFVTVLIEANWSRGRVLREYTVLLDPPTFAPPPATETTQAVTPPVRATQSDAGQIERTPAEPPAREEPMPPPVRAPIEASTPAPESPEPVAAEVDERSEPVFPDVDEQPEPIADNVEPPPAAETQPDPRDDVFDTSPGDAVDVVRGDTLWGIASRYRPDSRLTMNQVMMAIYEANQGAFGGNINLLREGTLLRIPSADDIYNISRADALSAAIRHHEEWQGGAQAASSSQPSLTLVPPDEDVVDDYADPASTGSDLSYSRADEIEQRISELEADIPDDAGLLEIRNNELAQLRAELARLRGEELPPVEEPAVVDDEPPVTVDDDDAAVADAATDEDQIFVDEQPADDEMAADAEAVTDDAAATADSDRTAPAVVVAPSSQPSIVDSITGFLVSIWGLIILAVIAALGALVWFARKAAEEDDEETLEEWEELDVDQADTQAGTATERLSALVRDDEEAIVVEEKASKAEMAAEMREPVVAPAPEPAPPVESLEETAETPVAQQQTAPAGFDQTDPLAEADFHMAYGLHDQAAELINNAIQKEPNRQDLMAKLCEVYFVWGNRDMFVAAAKQLKNAIGGDSSAEWDKIVIMGRQIASDEELFSGQLATDPARSVDLAFDEVSGSGAALDMDLGSESQVESAELFDIGVQTTEVDPGEGVFDVGAQTAETEADLIDLGGAIDTAAAADASSIDFVFDDDDDQDEGRLGDTGEMQSTEVLDDSEAVAGQTIESQFDQLAASQMVAALPEDTEEEVRNFEETGSQEADIDIVEIEDTAAGGAAATSETSELDLDDLGVDLGDLSDDAFEEPVESGVQDTGEMPGAATKDADETTTLLDATGMTEVLPDDFRVEGVPAAEAADDSTELDVPDLDDIDAANESTEVLADDNETLMAPLDEDDDDFAKTEALPVRAFGGNGAATDESAEVPSLVDATGELDVDFDDLTAALDVSEVGETINKLRDDLTIDQPMRDFNLDDSALRTQALSHDEFIENLHEAETMTEVGTKLDLARAYVDMGDPAGARAILEEVLDEGDDSQRQQAQQLLDSLPS